MPAVTPITTPEEDTVALPATPELQVPPATDAESDIVAPGQSDAGPLIVPAEGSGLTDIVWVATAEPQLFETA